MIIDQNSKKIKDSCINISKVLHKISRCSLFSAEFESHYTLFNHYIIEVIPKLNELYEKIINVDIIDMPIETQRICVVFSIDVIVVLNTILKDNKSRFEALPNSKFYTKTINRIKNQEANLNRIKSESPKKIFCALFNWEKIPNKTNLETQIQLNEIENGSSNRVAQVKYCIKSILKGLNIVNKKIYSHLNHANTNEHFIFALREIIELEEYNINNSDNYVVAIPLSWYSLYMTSNLWQDDNDFQSLYDDLYQEEEEKFRLLERQYNENAIEMGIIEQCVLNKLEKNKHALIRKNNDFIISLGKRIIDLTELALCLRRIEPINAQEKDIKNEKGKSSTKVSFWKKSNSVANKDISGLNSYIEVTPKVQCIHQRLKMMNTIRDFTNSKSTYYHTHTLKIFAQQLCFLNEVTNQINNGNDSNRVYETIQSAISLLENTLNKAPLVTTQTQPQTQSQYQSQSKINIEEGMTQYEEILINHLTSEDKLILREYIEDFILKKIHKRYAMIYLLYHLIYYSVCLSIVLSKDTLLYTALVKLSYLTKKDLNVQPYSINDTLIQLAAEGLNSIDLKRSPRDKLKMIASSFSMINTSVKYSLEREDSNVIDPVIRYVLLKATPKRLYCNIK